MRNAVHQLPLFRRLPLPKSQPPAQVWQPMPWARAVAQLWKLPKHLLRMIQPELPLPQRRGPQNRTKWTLDRNKLPYDVKPSKVIWMIQNHPPPKPLCYDTMERWQEDLMHMHTEGKSIVRRQDTGKWTTVDGRKVRISRTVTMVFDRIDFCDGCPAEWRRKMQGEKRCIVPVEAGC